MKKIVLLFILISGYAFSQSVNDYQYVIVPIKFDFLKKDDKYRLNTLTKLLLQKYGFKAFLSTEEIPTNVANKKCDFLYADVIENNGIMMTKVKVTLKDCKGKLLFETQFGGSREKEYAVAYNLALRDAGKSFDKLNYKYNGNFNVEIPAIQVKENDSSTESITEEPPLPPDPPIKENPFPKGFYFAQPTITGFQIIDNEPKIIMRLFETSQKNVFICEKGSVKGVVILKDQQWFFEYYKNGSLVSEPLNLKF